MANAKDDINKKLENRTKIKRELTDIQNKIKDDIYEYYVNELISLRDQQNGKLSDGDISMLLLRMVGDIRKIYE